MSKFKVGQIVAIKDTPIVRKINLEKGYILSLNGMDYLTNKAKKMQDYYFQKYGDNDDWTYLPMLVTEEGNAVHEEYLEIPNERV